MSEIIKFLERVGSSPRHALESAGLYEEELRSCVFDDASARALMARDVEAVGRALGATKKMFCMIVTPDQDSPVDVPDNDRRDEPSKEDEGERS